MLLGAMNIILIFKLAYSQLINIYIVVFFYLYHVISLNQSKHILKLAYSRTGIIGKIPVNSPNLGFNS